MLILMRGLPGSGKSTTAKLIKEWMLGNKTKAEIFSTDNLFMKDGKYNFDLSLLGHNHKKNLELTCNFLSYYKEGKGVAIVDNTNTMWKEMSPYISFAIDRQHVVSFCEPNTHWKFNVDELVKRNTHNVPREAIEKMLGRWQHKEQIFNTFEEVYGFSPTYYSIS